MMFRFAAAMVIAFALPAPAVRADDSASLTRFEFEQIRFAAPARLTFYAPSEEVANQAAADVFRRLKEFDRIMSDYDPDSELSRLCKNSKPGHPVIVSEELWTVLQASQRFSKLTNGAFDISVGPAVKLWRKSRRSKALPSPEEVQSAIAKSGWESIRLNPADRSVELLKEGMQLDLGGIGQGYAADEAYQVLKDRGLTRALVDISGDFRAGDPPPDRSGWRIEIESLKRKSVDAPVGTARTLVISNAAVSTSGDAYNFVEINGQRYSHIVDPKTGLGLTTSCSVTIIARDAITADALDTAVCVLGVEQGLATVRSVEGAEALFALLKGDQIEITETKGLMSYITSE